MTRGEDGYTGRISLPLRRGARFRGGASPGTVQRVVLYCRGLQAFAHRLGRADLLDDHGGSDIVQVAPASLTFVQGQDRIKGLRLKPKGLYRWYASCCN